MRKEEVTTVPTDTLSKIKIKISFKRIMGGKVFIRMGLRESGKRIETLSNKLF